MSKEELIPAPRWLTATGRGFRDAWLDTIEALGYPTARRKAARRALTEERLAQRRRIDADRRLMRQEEQLEALEVLATLTPYRLEDTTEYDQEPTADRMTTPDTSSTTLKENPMPALHNRALALKLAVENYAFTPASDENSEAISLVDDSGTLDENLLTGVLALADRFVAYLGADEPSTSVPSGDSAQPAAAPRVSETEQAIEDIRGLLSRLRPEIGGRATDAALEQIDQLRDATRGGDRGDVVMTAIGFVDRAGRREFGSVVADRLITGLRAL